jgi:hypothetical protein
VCICCNTIFLSRVVRSQPPAAKSRWKAERSRRGKGTRERTHGGSNSDARVDNERSQVSPSSKSLASNSLLDRGYGKPQQHITGEGSQTFVIRARSNAKRRRNGLRNVEAL